MDIKAKYTNEELDFTSKKEYINENLNLKSIKPHEFINLEVTKAIVIWKTSSKEEAITSLKNLLANNKNEVSVSYI